MFWLFWLTQTDAFTKQSSFTSTKKPCQSPFLLSWTQQHELWQHLLICICHSYTYDWECEHNKATQTIPFKSSHDIEMLYIRTMQSLRMVPLTTLGSLKSSLKVLNFSMELSSQKTSAHWYFWSETEQIAAKVHHNQPRTTGHSGNTSRFQSPTIFIKPMHQSTY